MKLLKLLLFAGIWIVSPALYAQQGTIPDLSAFEFRNTGPAFTSGRIADIAVQEENPAEYFLAIASGGIWKTENNGTTFEPVFDNYGSYSIGCLEIDPSNPHVIWAGTGENNNQRSVGYGDGIYRSEDGGKSWEKRGLGESEHIGMIRVHPEDGNTIYAAAYGPLWNNGGQRGLYKSTDAGKNWKKILETDEHTGINEIHFDPRDPDVLYATAHQRRRHVWTYVSGGPGSAIYKSTDGGENWKKPDKGLPGKDMGRIALAIPPSNPDIIYAMIEGHGFYRSTDRGASWEKRNDYYSSGNYYVELFPHPEDEATVYSMDTRAKITRDGGKNFENIPAANKHVDDHALWIHPTRPAHMLVGSDGGLYETYDNGDNWHFKANLPVTQFYRVSVDNAEPFYNVYGGTQDNFSLAGTSRTLKKSGITNDDWEVIKTGDGFKARVDPENPNIVYAQSQYGWLVRHDRVSGEQMSIRPMQTSGDEPYRFNWDAPLIISPHDNKTLYFAANKVFRSNDRGDSWDVISPDLTREINRDRLPVMGKVQSLDAVARHKSTSPYGNITTLSESPLKKGLLIAGTDDGLVQLSRDDGENWQKINRIPNIPQNTYVNRVLASQHDENTFYVVFNNHKNGDFQPYIVRTNDMGKSWESLSADLPERGSVFTIAEDHESRNLLFTGTEFGLFASFDGGKNWEQMKGNLPTIAIRDMAIQERENDLVLASFGRGIYILDDYSTLREIAKADLTKKEAFLWSGRPGIIYHPSRPLGYGELGFMGASFYSAPNPEPGVTMTFHLRDTVQKLTEERRQREKEARKSEKEIPIPSAEGIRAEKWEGDPYLLFVIKDEKGKEVRKLTAKAKKGLQRIHWDGKKSHNTRLKENGSENPGGSFFCPPSTYYVQAWLSHRGKLNPLGDSAAIELETLYRNEMAGDPGELLAFQREIEKIEGQLKATGEFLSRAEDLNRKLKAGFRNTIGAPVETLEKIDEMKEDILRNKMKLEGDKVLADYDYPTVPGLKRRLGVIRHSSWNSTYAPSDAQQKNLRSIGEETRELLSECRDLQTKMEYYRTALGDAGGPWLDGQLPPLPR